VGPCFAQACVPARGDGHPEAVVAVEGGDRRGTAWGIGVATPPGCGRDFVGARLVLVPFSSAP